MQFGLGVKPSKAFSAGSCRNVFAAMKKLKPMPIEGSMSKFSHPSGKPASLEGNWSWSTRSWWPELEARVKVSEKRAALCGVVTTVTIMLCCASIVARSIMGSMWPGDMSGNKTK